MARWIALATIFFLVGCGNLESEESEKEKSDASQPEDDAEIAEDSEDGELSDIEDGNPPVVLASPSPSCHAETDWELCDLHGAACGDVVDFDECEESRTVNCGVCETADDCIEGQCICRTNCEGRQCGDDGCGSVCGECLVEESCTDDWQCEIETWRDPQYGMTWQKNPAHIWMTLADAENYCLALGGGTWLLPSINGLRTLVRSCIDIEPGRPCELTSNCTSEECYQNCEACAVGEGRSDDGCYWPSNKIKGHCGFYHSQSKRDAYTSWGLDFSTAGIQRTEIEDTAGVRCRKISDYE